METRIKEGAENLLQVLEADALPDSKELAKQVKSELHSSKLKIVNIKRKIDELRDSLPGAFCPRLMQVYAARSYSLRCFVQVHLLGSQPTV